MAPSGGKKGKEVDQSPASILRHGDYTVSLTSWLAGGPAVIGKKPRRVLDMKVERDRKSEKSDRSLVLASSKKSDTAASDMEVAISRPDSLTHTSRQCRQTESSSSQRIVNSRPFLTYEEERVEKFTIRPPPVVFNNPEDVPTGWLETILNQRKYGESSKAVSKKAIGYEHNDLDNYEAGYLYPRSKSKSLSKKSSSFSRKASEIRIKTKSSSKKSSRKVEVTTADVTDESSSDAESPRPTKTKKLEHRSKTKERRKTKKVHVESSDEETADDATADSESSDIELTTIKLRSKPTLKKKPIASSKESGSAKVKIETRDKKGKRKVVVEASSEEDVSSDGSMSGAEPAPPKKGKSKNRVTVTETTRKGKKKIVTVESSDEGEITHIKSRSSMKGKISEVHVKASDRSKTKKVTFENTDEAEITDDATTDVEPVPTKAHKGKDKTKAKAADNGKTKAKEKIEVKSSEAAETTNVVTTEAETTEAETTEAATTEAEATDAEVTVAEKPKATPESDDGWTPSQDAILLSMKEGGESWASIAKATGQNKKVVIKRHQELLKSGVAQVKKGNQNNSKKGKKAHNKENRSNDASSSQTPAAEETFGFGDLPGFGGDQDDNNNNDNNGGDAWSGGDQNNNTDNNNNGSGGDAWGNGDQNNNGFDSGFAPSWGADCTGGGDQGFTNNDNNNADNNNNGFDDACWGGGDQDNNGGGNVGPGFGDGWAADYTGGGNSKPPSNAGSKNGSNRLPINKPPSNSGNNGWGGGSNSGNKPPNNNGGNNGGSHHGSNNKSSSNNGGSNHSNRPPSNNVQGRGSNQGNRPPSNSGNNNGWGGGSNQGSNNNRPPSNNGNGWNNGESNQGNRSSSNRPPSNNGGFGLSSNQGHNNSNTRAASNNGGQGSGLNNGNRPPSNNGDWGGVGPTQDNNSGWGSSSNHGNKPPSNSGGGNNGGSNQGKRPPSNRPPSNNGNWGSGSNQGSNDSNHTKPPRNNGGGSNHGGSNNNRPPSNNGWGGGSNHSNNNRPPSNNGDWGNSGQGQDNNAGWGSGSNQVNNSYTKPLSNTGSARGSNHNRPPSNNGGGGWGSGSNNGNRPPSNNGDWGGGSNQGNKLPSNNGWGSGSNQGNNNDGWASNSNHGKPPRNNGGWGSGSNSGFKPPSNNGSSRGSGSHQGNQKKKEESEKDREIRALKERVSEEKLHRLEAEVLALKLQQDSANRLNQNKGSENGGMGWNTGGSDKNWKVPPSVAGSLRSNNQPDGWKSRPASGEVWGVAQNPDYKPASNSGWVPNEIVPPQNTKPPSNKPPSNNNNNKPPGSPDGWIYGSPTESEKQRVAEKVESWKGSISPPKEEGRWGTPDGGWPADQAENAPNKPRGRSPAARSSASAKNWKQGLTYIEEEPADNGYEMWKKPSGNNNGKLGGNADRKSSGNYNNKKPSREQYGWNSGHDAAAEPVPPRGSQISTPEFKPVETNEWTKDTRNDKPPSKNGDWTPELGATAGWMADCTKPPSNRGWAGGSNQGKNDNNKPPSNAGSARGSNNGKSPSDNGGWTYAPISVHPQQNIKAPSLTGFKAPWAADCTGSWDGKPPANDKPSKEDSKNALNIHTVTDLPGYSRDVDIQAPIGLSGFPPGDVMDYHAPAPVPVPPVTPTPYSGPPGCYPATPCSTKGTKTPNPPGYISDKTSAHSTILPLYNKHTPFYDATPPAPAPGPSYQVGQRSFQSHQPPLSEQDLKSLYKQVVFAAISSGQPLLQPKPDHLFTLRDCWVLIALNDQYDRSSASKEKWFDLQAKFASATGGRKVDAIVLRAKVRQAEKEAKKVEGWEDEEVGWMYKAWRDREREREREKGRV